MALDRDYTRSAMCKLTYTWNSKSKLISEVHTPTGAQRIYRLISDGKHGNPSLIRDGVWDNVWKALLEWTKRYDLDYRGGLMVDHTPIMQFIQQVHLTLGCTRLIGRSSFIHQHRKGGNRTNRSRPSSDRYPLSSIYPPPPPRQ